MEIAVAVTGVVALAALALSFWQAERHRKQVFEMSRLLASRTLTEYSRAVQEERVPREPTDRERKRMVAQHLSEMADADPYSEA
jgi:FtsZ-interacting cell division protein ZipA